jgi:hypothetical protein
VGSMGSLRKEGSVSPWLDMQQFSRLRYMLFWPVFMKYNHLLDQRNILVYVLTVRWH